MTRVSDEVAPDRLLSAAEAYLLGALAAAGFVSGSSVLIRPRGGSGALRRALSLLGVSDTEASDAEGAVLLPRGFSERALTRLSITAPATSGRILVKVLPELPLLEAWVFVRGLLEAAGSISQPERSPLKVRFLGLTEGLASGLVELVGAPPSRVTKKHLHFDGPAGLDLLGHVYDGLFGDELLCAGALYRRGFVRRYRSYCQKVAGLSFTHNGPGAALYPVIHAKRIEPGAVLPSKERISDSGYDLTLLSVRKRIGEVTLYGTGLIIQPPEGWYFDVVPRSSIIKRGYIIANSVGVIDRAYRGELMVPLIKIDPSAPDLELPARVAQMIPRPIVHFSVADVSELSETQRGQGGFGSSGL